MNDEVVHPAFPPPANPEEVLWRYLDAEKFEWLVCNGRLFMPSSQFLGDPLEGTSPRGQLDWWQSLSRSAASEEQRKVIEQNREKVSRFAAGFRPHYYVSCWHMNAAESEKMWQCYTSTPSAVAVATTYRALRSSLPKYVQLGVVRYIDYSSEKLPSLNMFEYITHKNTTFAFERELRAVAFPPAMEELGASHFQANLFELEARQGFLVYAPAVEVSSLVQRVVLHPSSSEEFAENIRLTCKSAGLPKPEMSEFKRVREQDAL